MREVIADQFRSGDYWAKLGYRHTEIEEPPDVHGSVGASPITVVATKDLPKSEDQATAPAKPQEE